MAEFEITDDGVLRKYSGRQENVVIPEHIIHIGAFAFHNCNFIRSIAFPDSVIHIRKSAFQGCKNLERIILPDYLADIGEGAFCQCRNLETVKFPRRLEKIGKDAFLGCTRLKEIILPDSISVIESGAFQYCENLESVKLPEHLAKLENYLFSYCYMLSEIEIPETVTHIGEGAFYQCNSLPELHLPDGLKFISGDAVGSERTYYFEYRGIRFSNRGNIGLCACMIGEHRFRVTLPAAEKLSILTQLYHQNPGEENLLLYLKEEFSGYVRTLIHKNEANLLHDIMKAGPMIQKESIDGLIRFAIEEKAYETQVMLTDYKREYFGFETPAERAGRLFLD